MSNRKSLPTDSGTYRDLKEGIVFSINRRALVTRALYLFILYFQEKSYFLLTDFLTRPTTTQITIVIRMSTTVLPIGRSMFMSFL